MAVDVLEEFEQLETRGVLVVEPWGDPLLDRLGYDPRAPYVERFWLPVLGPSTVFLLRHLARELDEAPAGFACDLRATARALGLGERHGRNAPFVRTIARAVDFDAARFSDGRLIVRRRLAPLARRHVARLPESLQAEHERFLRREAARPRLPEHDEHLRRRGRQLALSLLQLGEDPASVIGHLRRWRFPADLAETCLEWASEQRVLERRRVDAEPASGRRGDGNATAPVAL
jgi:hypothetical protein